MPKTSRLLKEAIVIGNKDQFVEVMNRMVTFPFRDEKGNTFLHLAVSAPQHALFMTNQLLETGQLNVNAKNNEQDTPLHAALLGGDVAVVRLLMAYGANPNAQNAKGQTSIKLALLKNQTLILHHLSQFHTANLVEEQLQLTKNMLSLIEPASIVLTALNNIPLWYTYLPVRHHAVLKLLESNLADRRFLWPLSASEKIDKSSKSGSKDKKLSAKSSPKVLKTKESKKSLKPKPILGELVTWLGAIKAAAEEESTRPELKTVSQTCDHLLQYYQSPLTEEEKEAPSRCVWIYNENMGYQAFSLPASKRFLPYFEPNDSEARGQTYKENETGLHDVVQMNHVHYKISPTAPGIEYAVHALCQLVTGQGSPPTALLILIRLARDEALAGTDSVAVLASKTVVGQSFRDLIEKKPQEIPQIDPYSYSLQAILAILTQSVDGKADNYIARSQVDHHGQFLQHEIVAIDTDESFAEPIFATRAGRHALMLKNILFSLPQYKAPVDLVLRKQLLAQEPALIVMRWLKLLHAYNEPFEAYFEQGEYRDTLKNIGLPLRLVPKTAMRLYQRLITIQEQLKNNPELTHEGLLKACYPLVARYYDYVTAEAKGDYFLASELIYRGKFFEELTNLSDDEKKSLSDVTALSDAYVKERTQTVTSAVQEFMQALDFSAFTPHIQHSILSQLMSDFKDIPSLTLKGVTVLGGDLLNALSMSLNQLERLTLLNCGSLSVQGIQALLTCFPNLVLTLGNSPLAPHELLAISEYCPHFYLLLPDGSRHLVSPKNPALLPSAMQQNDLVLQTFLLLAGFHLTQTGKRYSPLQEAVLQKNVHLVRELIRYGSPVNQLVAKISALDKAYEGLKASSTDLARTMDTEIIGVLLEAGAIECFESKPLLEVGLKLCHDRRFAGTLPEKLMNFALVHNQMTPAIVQALVSPNTTTLDWSRRTYTGYQLNDAVLQALFKQAPKLQRLNLSGCQGIDVSHIKQCVSLGVKEITLDFAQAVSTEVLTNSALDLTLQKAGIKLMINAVQLNGSKLVQAQFDLMLRALTHPNNAITQLEITNSTLSTDQLSKLAKALSGFASLKRLTLRATGFGKKQVGLISEWYSIVSALKKHPLEEVALESNELDASRMDGVKQLLEEHPSLKVLSLFDNPIGDGGLKALSKVLRGHRLLEKLNLNQVGLTDTSLLDWIRVGLPPRLSFLDLGYNKLSQDSAPAVVELACLNQTLEILRCDGQDSLMAALEKTQLTVILQENQQKSQRRQLLKHHQRSFLQTEQASLTLQPNKLPSSPRGAPPKKIASVKEKKLILVELQEMGCEPWVFLLTQHRFDLKQCFTFLKAPQDFIAEERQSIETKLAEAEEERHALEETLQTQTAFSKSKPVETASDEQYRMLWQQFERTQAEEWAVSLFGAEPNLLRFYRLVQLKLEGFWLGIQLLASQISRMDMGEKHALENLTELRLALCGAAVSLMPSELFTRSNTQLILKKAAYWQKLGSLTTLLKVAEQTARTLTTQLTDQIKPLAVTTPESEGGGLGTLLFKDEKPVASHHPVDALADVVVLRIVMTVLSEKLKPQNLSGLVRQCVVFGQADPVLTLGSADSLSGKIEKVDYADLRLPNACLAALGLPLNVNKLSQNTLTDAAETNASESNVTQTTGFEKISSTAAHLKFWRPGRSIQAERALSSAAPTTTAVTSATAENTTSSSTESVSVNSTTTSSSDNTVFPPSPF